MLDDIFEIVFKNNIHYSDNQKTVEQEDDMKAVPKVFDAVTKQIFYLVNCNISC